MDISHPVTDILEFIFKMAQLLLPFFIAFCVWAARQIFKIKSDAIEALRLAKANEKESEEIKNDIGSLSKTMTGVQSSITTRIDNLISLFAGGGK